MCSAPEAPLVHSSRNRAAAELAGFSSVKAQQLAGQRRNGRDARLRCDRDDLDAVLRPNKPICDAQITFSLSRKGVAVCKITVRGEVP